MRPDLIHVRDDMPFFLLIWRQIKARCNQIGSGFATDVMLCCQRPTGAKCIDLSGAEQMRARIQSHLPGDGCLERLARLGLVGQCCTEGENTQARLGSSSFALVRIGQITADPLSCGQYAVTAAHFAGRPANQSGKGIPIIL